MTGLAKTIPKIKNMTATTDTARKLSIPDEVRKHKYYEQWRDFHLSNREVIRNVIRKLEDARARGKQRASVRDALNAVRWEDWLGSDDQPYKVNNNHASIYARVIAHNFPEYASMITFRSIAI